MNKKVVFKILVLGVTALTLAACSHLPRKYQFIRNNSNDYRTAYTTQPISVPPGYSSSKFKEYFVVPNPQLAKKATPIDLLPPDLNRKSIPRQQHWWSNM